MPTFFQNHSAQTFKDLILNEDPNTKAIAFAIELFVDATIEDDNAAKLQAWKGFITALDERIGNRIHHEINKFANGKELDARLREYLYKQSEGVKEG
jgi:thioesterase domain-containing protein